MENIVEVRKIHYGSDCFAVFVNGQCYDVSIYTSIYGIDWIPSCFDNPEEAAKFGKMLKDNERYKQMRKYEDELHQKNIAEQNRDIEKENKIKNTTSFYV